MQSFRTDARRGLANTTYRFSSDSTRPIEDFSAQLSPQLSPYRRQAMMTTPMAITPTLQPPQASDYLPSISPSVVYSTAHAVWTPQELQLLHKGLADFPVDTFDNVTRYIKIAASIPGKCVRDVAFRVKAQSMEQEPTSRELYAKRMRIDTTAELSTMAKQQQAPLDDAQLSALFQENVHAINMIRNNLLNGKANENGDVMVKFRDNCQTLKSAIAGICNTIPPMPIQMDTSLISDGNNLDHL